MSVSETRAISELASDCLMARTRLIARKITALYEDRLRRFGIQGSQLNLLAAVAYAGPVRRSELSRYLSLENSTLTRNLHVMEINGWIEQVSDHIDGRAVPVRATRAGTELLLQVMPEWRKAQREAEKLMGPQAKKSIMRLSAGIFPD